MTSPFEYLWLRRHATGGTCSCGAERREARRNVVRLRVVVARANDGCGECGVVVVALGVRIESARKLTGPFRSARLSPPNALDEPGSRLNARTATSDVGSIARLDGRHNLRLASCQIHHR